MSQNETIGIPITNRDFEEKITSFAYDTLKYWHSNIDFNESISFAK